MRDSATAASGVQAPGAGRLKNYYGMECLFRFYSYGPFCANVDLDVCELDLNFVD
jgi:hypothetical protein